MYPSGSLMRRVLAMAATALAVAAVLAPTGSATGHRAARPAANSGTPQSSGALPYQNPPLPVRQRVADLLGRMTLDEKIGQMTQAERACIDADTDPQITTDYLGSVLSGGGSVPTPNTPDRLGRHGRPLPGARRWPPGSHIPLIYGIDTVHGDGNMYGATVFPHNIGLGATRDPALVRRRRARRRLGDPVDRAAVGLRALHLRGA